MRIGVRDSSRSRWVIAATKLAGLCLPVLLCAANPGVAGNLEELGPVRIEGEVKGAEDISALGIAGDYLVIGSDETTAVQILKATADGYKVERSVSLARGNNTAEIDIEAIAIDGNTVYVIGSHAMVRPRVKPNDSQRDNRRRLAQAPSRNGEFRARNTLARFSLDGGGKPSQPRFSGLGAVLDKTPPFSLFRDLPSKENGVDIEALAFKDGKLYAGFRAPVLRENFVPVLVFGFKHPERDAQVRYLNLCGRGVRDLVSVDGGFLVLAGPLGDGPGGYQIYFWDGTDTVPGKDHPTEGAVRLLAELPRSDVAAKAEGMAVLGAQAHSYELLIAYDGAKNDAVRRYRLRDTGVIADHECPEN